MDIHVAKLMGHMQFDAEHRIVVLDASSNLLMKIVCGVVVVAKEDKAEAKRHGWHYVRGTTKQEREAGLIRVARN